MAAGRSATVGPTHYNTAVHQPWRTSAGRRLAAKKASAAAEAAVHRLTAEVATWKRRFEDLLKELAEPEVAERLAAVAPWLSAHLKGHQPEGAVVLARNVAMHAKVVPPRIVGAPAAALRRAQKGPRLDRPSPRRFCQGVRDLLSSTSLPRPAVPEGNVWDM